MEKKKVTREKMAVILVKSLKEWSKGMGTTTNKKVPLELNNWASGFGRNSKWCRSEIRVGQDVYEFTDREITEKDFIDMLKRALADSGVSGKVHYDECGDGYWCSKQYYFKDVELYAAPCKEFIKLAKTIQKYSGKVLDNFDVYYTSVCGKRSAWSDTGRMKYLCYEPEKCQAIIDYIKKNRTSKDTLSVKVDEFFSHGDETDYKYAQHCESEWYGYRGTKLHIKVTTPSGKGKAYNYWEA